MRLRQLGRASAEGRFRSSAKLDCQSNGQRNNETLLDHPSHPACPPCLSTLTTKISTFMDPRLDGDRLGLALRPNHHTEEVDWDHLYHTVLTGLPAIQLPPGADVEDAAAAAARLAADGDAIHAPAPFLQQYLVEPPQKASRQGPK